MKINELDVTTEQLRTMAEALDEAGFNATYDEDLQEAVLIVGGDVFTFVQTTEAEKEEAESKYWAEDAAREAVAL